MIDTSRDTVIAIQGGGIYALSLLGQVKAILSANYRPVAFAGSSGGAILSSLLWSGLHPDQIEAECIASIKEDPLALVDLLGPFEAPPRGKFDFDAFVTLLERVRTLISTFPGPEPASKLKKLAARFSNIRSVPGGVRFFYEIDPHLRRRGMFRGDHFEQFIDRLLRKGFVEQTALLPKGELLRFGHIHSLMRAQKLYRPPLLITATNLSRRRLDVISSIDERFHNVPIAAAVRASAGFPFFFRPKHLPECPDGGWFVDGGVVSNFPVWTFSDAFREQMATGAYRLLALKPWIRVGLRVVDDPGDGVEDLTLPDLFFRSLFGMFTGTARNQLEDILSDRAARSIVVKQPTSTTGGPEGFLDIKALTEQRIKAMVEKGKEFAQGELDRLKSPGIYNLSDRSSVQAQLAALIKGSALVLGGDPDRLKLRANVFVPTEASTLKTVFSYSMEGDTDAELELPNLTAGVTGTCFQCRSGLVCNLRKIAELRRQPRYSNMLGMSNALQEQVRKDRTWLASVPIFDPYEMKVSRTAKPRLPMTAMQDIAVVFDGPVLGVLNLDAGWDYKEMELDADPCVHISDSRIQAVMDIMWSRSYEIGPLIVAHFGPSEHS